MIEKMSNTEEIKEFAGILTDNLGSGQLEQVVGLFQYNETLYDTIGILLKSERINVRLGITVVLEDLKDEGIVNKERALKNIIPLLADENPTVRGDAVNLMGVLGDLSHLPMIEPLLNDSNRQVAEIAEEAIDDIRSEG